MTKNRKRLGLAIPISLHEKLADKAQYQGKTINAVCLDIFWEYFEPNNCRRKTSIKSNQQEERDGNSIY